MTAVRKRVEIGFDAVFMALRHATESRRFARAARDPGITAELALLDAEFRMADRETWPE